VRSVKAPIQKIVKCKKKKKITRGKKENKEFNEGKAGARLKVQNVRLGKGEKRTRDL